MSKPRTHQEVTAALDATEGVPNASQLFTWSEDQYFWLARAKKYIGNKGDFGKIAAAFKAMGGQYVSAGKNSHFKVPKSLITRRALTEIIADLRKITGELEAWVS